MRRLLTLLLVILLTIVPATALSEDFSLSSTQSTINVCACSYTKVPIRLWNTGDVTSVYQLSKAGSAASFATFTEHGATLEPGQSKEVTMFVRAACGAKGTYDISITATTIFEKEATLNQRVSVQACNNLNLVPRTPLTKSACPCTPVEYTFMLRNDGVHPETYTVTVDPSEHVSIGSSRVIVAPGEEIPIVVFINKPCGVYGEFDYTLRVVGERAGWVSQIQLELNVNACYNYQVLVTPSISMCKAEGKTAHIPLTIQNTARIKNTYDIKAKIGSTTINYDPVTLRGGEQQVLTLGVSLDDVPAGENDLIITTSSRRGGDRLDKVVAFNALVCDGSDEVSYSKLWVIIPLILILLLILFGIATRKRGKDDDDVEDYYESSKTSTRVTKQTKEVVSKRKPKDLPGWFLPLLIVFIALGILSLLLGALYIVDTQMGGAGTTYVDSLDDLAIDPGTFTPDEAMEPEQTLLDDTLSDVSIIEQPWFLIVLMIIVFLVISLLVLTLMLKTRKNESDESTMLDEQVSTTIKEEKEEIKKIKNVDTKETKAEKRAQNTEKVGRLERTTTSNLTWYLLAFLLLLLLAGGAFAMYHLPTLFNGSDSGLLLVDETGLETHRAAIIARMGSTTDIPLTFRNPSDGDAHVKLDVPIDWITFTSQSLDISAFEEEGVTMSVSPDETTETGRYRLQFLIETPNSIVQENVIIHVLAPGQSPRSMWAWAGFGFLTLLILLLLLFFIRVYHRKHFGDTRKEKRGSIKEIKDTGADFTKTKRLKRKKLVTWSLAILLLLLVLAAIFGIVWRYTGVFGDHSPAPSNDDLELDEILLYATPGLHESRVVIGDDRTIIPMRITNIHDDRDYKISIYEDIPWISVDSDKQWVPPGESIVIPLVVDANRGVKNGAYRLSVDVRIADNLDSIFTNDIILVVNHNRRLYLTMLYFPYIILGFLLIIYLFTTKRKLRRRRRLNGDMSDVKIVKTNGKSKTSIKLK